MKKILFVLTAIISLCFFLLACSKKSDSTPTPPATDACAGKTITVSNAAVASSPCGSGTITVTASGSTGFTYSIDGGAFQASNTFSQVTPGDHTIVVKDGAGCTKSNSVTVESLALGTLFTAVKSLIATNCLSCHSGASAEGAKDFSKDCVIESSADRIKVRAVDGNPSFMPQGGQLSAADKKTITDWIAAGGKFNN